MKFKKQFGGMNKGIVSIGATGMMGGAMSSAVTKMGGDASGISAATGFMPAVGSLVGAKATIGMATQLMPKSYRRKQRR